MLEIWQIILLALFAGIAILDGYTFMTGIFHNVVLVGVIAGLIVGDVELGLIAGGSMQMVALGIAAIGGASVPDYRSATIIAIALASLNGGLDVLQEYIVSVGIPVAALVIQCDVLAKTINIRFKTMIDKAVERVDTKAITRYTVYGGIVLFLSRFIPVLIGLIVGPKLVELMEIYIPTWLINGLSIAGGLLPVVGFVILLRFLPSKGNLHYILLGFVLSAYLGLPTMGVALIGAVIAIILYKQEKAMAEVQNEGDGI